MLQSQVVEGHEKQRATLASAKSALETGQLPPARVVESVRACRGRAAPRPEVRGAVPAQRRSRRDGDRHPRRVALRRARAMSCSARCRSRPRRSMPCWHCWRGAASWRSPAPAAAPSRGSPITGAGGGPVREPDPARRLRAAGRGAAALLGPRDARLGALQGGTPECRAPGAGGAGGGRGSWPG